MKNYKDTDIDDYYNGLDEYEFQDEMSQLLTNVLKSRYFEDEVSEDERG